jgi:hypothetical protein
MMCIAIKLSIASVGPYDDTYTQTYVMHTHKCMLLQHTYRHILTACRYFKTNKTAQDRTTSPHNLMLEDDFDEEYDRLKNDNVNVPQVLIYISGKTKLEK